LPQIADTRKPQLKNFTKSTHSEIQQLSGPKPDCIQVSERSNPDKIPPIYILTQTRKLMRQLIVLAFISMDGVIQGPGSPEEDPSDGFKYGGWVAPYDDAEAGKIMERLLRPADLLLGRKTFEIWEDYWPNHTEYWPTINEVTKYVLSSSRDQSQWTNSVFVESVSEIEKIKGSEGLDLHVWGSSEVVKLLLQHGLVDDFWLMIHPVILGKGKRLFDDNAIPAAFTLADSAITSTGVIFAHYQRSGDVAIGKIGA
jgi:dihydrofolate reductase